MLDALLNILNGFTDIPFVELAWSHSPDEKYGVITLDNQLALDADADPVSEKMLTGFVDVFVKKPKDLSTVSDVESALKRLGIYFAQNSVQFEDDTGYVHYEWTWHDTTGILFVLYTIKFVYNTNNGIVVDEQHIHYYQMPSPPNVPVWHSIVDRVFDGWDKPITPATEDKFYLSRWRVNVEAEDHGLVLNEDGNPFTADQRQFIIDEFGNGVDGLRVLVVEPDGTEFYATDVDEQGISWDNGKYARWAA
jgi:hypothetical protein